MTVNRYFNRVEQKSEQDMFEDTVIEMIQMQGVDVWYIPRDDFEMDPILKEPSKTTFRKAVRIEVYQPDAGQLGGEQNIASQFGFRVEQNTELVMSKKRFAELGLNQIRPREGDLIYIGDPYDMYGSYINALFEISQVWYTSPDWQFGKHFTYRIVCHTFRNSYEQFQTGISGLDTLNGDNVAEVKAASNDEFEEAAEKLLVFDPKHPFGGY